jgi:uncharacterized protein with HEPN domain
MWRDEAYLLDMLLAARKVRTFTVGVDEERFRADEVLQHAILRLIQIVGEAARKVSPEFKQSHLEIPWQEIVGMRHMLVHEYFRIIPEKIWDVVERDLSNLISMIEPLVPPDTTAEPEK